MHARRRLSAELTHLICAACRCRNTLNAKPFKKIGFQLSKEELDALCNCTPQAVERALKKLQQYMAKCGLASPRAAAVYASAALAPTRCAAYGPPCDVPARFAPNRVPAASMAVARHQVQRAAGERAKERRRGGSRTANGHQAVPAAAKARGPACHST